MFFFAGKIHWIIIGGESAGVPFGETFSPEEAWNIDTKMDDGKPGLGGFKAFCVNTCSDVVDAATSEYRLSDDSAQCWAVISLD